MNVRLARLEGLRRVALIGELRALAAAERRVAELSVMQARLGALVDGVPVAGATAGRKAAATTRAALGAAARRVGTAHATALATRGAAAVAAAQALARADAVARAACARAGLDP